MKKYYLPTSSLNLNNILSTESVSPKAFYDCRKFGYDRWTSIPENSCDFAITLYAKPGAFVRHQTDIEDHPLLIEFLTDEEFKGVSDGVYACDHTLYFNPTIVRFIFFSEKDKSVALSLTESSLETKLVAVYKSRFSVETFEERYVPIAVRGFESVNLAEVEKDRQINRMKGLLYGYYVGASVAATSEQVQKLNAYLEIQNVFASVISGDTHVPTAAQRARLDEMFARLNGFDPLFKALIDFEGGVERVVELLAILRKHGKDPFSNDVDGLIASLKSESGEVCLGIRWVKDKLVQLQGEMVRGRTYLSPEREELVVVDRQLHVVSKAVLSDSESQKLFISWVNEVLVKGEFSGKISSCKGELVTALALKAKEVYGETWTDGNVVRRYLNALRRHVIGKDPFDGPWANDLLSSVAAVVSKGDDWEGLLSFMQKKGMTEYRLAFAMYGELNGFANLTRDFTDMVLSGQNTERRAMYQEFHGQLLGRQIDWTMTDVRLPETLHRRVLAFFESPAYAYKGLTKADKAALKHGVQNALRQFGGGNDAEMFVEVLSRFEGDGWAKSKKPWKLMQAAIAPGYTTSRKRGGKGRKKQGVVVEELPFVSNEPVRQKFTSILEYGEWLDACVELMPTGSKERRYFCEDVEYFIKNREQNPGPEYAELVKDKSNSAVLNRLRAFLEAQRDTKNPKQDWKLAVYAKIPIAEIINKLRGMYGC